MTNAERLAQFMQGMGSADVQWFFSGTPLCANDEERAAFAAARLRFTGFRYVASPVVRHSAGVERRQSTADGVRTTEIRTSSGVLVSHTKDSHPIGYPVKTIEDIRVLAEIEANTTVSLDQSRVSNLHPVLDRFSINPTPVQQLLQYDTGMEGFWYLYNDYPGEMRDLLDLMMVNYLRECELVAGLPTAAVRMVENTSTTFISPRHYRALSVPQVRSAVEVFHKRGKFVAAHMCGLLKDLLPYFAETGMDGIHSVTPPPVGNTPYEMVFQALGDTFCVEGRMGTTCWLDKSAGEIRSYVLTHIGKQRMRRSPFILEVHMDGMKGITYQQYARAQEALAGLF
jgi:hypothetical protein